MAYDAKAVANFFLNLARTQGDSISPMKLQKLVYYAHGWYAGYTGKPLIDEAVEAWQYGPVIPSLYHEFKRFGSGAISHNATVFGGDLEELEVQVPADPGIQSFLSSVWKSYGKYTGTKLSEMTHAVGGPWDETRKASAGMRSADIPFDIIERHFKEAVARAKAAKADA